MASKKKLHRKPTTQELEDGMKKTLAELDELDDPKEDTPTKDEDPKEPDPTPESGDESEDVESGKETEDDKPEDTDDSDDEEALGDSDTKETPEPQKDEKLKKAEKRYADSSREAHLLYSKNKKMTEAIEKAGEVADPTEDELKSEYPEWEEMSDFERKMAKSDMVKTRKLDAIANVAKDFKDLDKWNRKVDEFIADPATIAEHPEIDGKEEEFRMFAITKPSRQNLDFEDLVHAFLYEEDQKPKPKSRTKMMETGTGGINEKPKNKGNKISVDESRRLRNTDYKKYLHYVRNNLIEDEEI